MNKQRGMHRRRSPLAGSTFLAFLWVAAASISKELPELPRDAFRTFSCGKLHYKIFYLDVSRGWIYVGAMNHVFKLNLADISRTVCERDHISLPPTNEESCINKGKSQYECMNHIRVIQPIGDGSRLYICGTNAHNPKDWVIYHSEYVPGVKSGAAKCPFDPVDNSTAVWVESGNPGNLSGLYSGTVAEFTKADTVIFRADLYDLNSGRLEYPFKRTLKYDSKWLDRTNFVGSFDIGEHVYFFFRETAVEYINCGKKVYSRIARVCKRDTGGKNILTQNWTTFLKARLNCSLPGEFPFYFNEIQSVYQRPHSKDRFYAAFTTAPSGLPGSAICTFHLRDIEAVFLGRFKEQSSSSSAWLPVLNGHVPEPRPGACVNDTQALPDTVLNFIRSHTLMDEAVRHENERPVFHVKDVLFTHIVVDIVRSDTSRFAEYTVFFAGTETGRIYKIVQWRHEDTQAFDSQLLEVVTVTSPEAVNALEISPMHHCLYVASESRVVQMRLSRCSEHPCLLCVRDPYCGWHAASRSCRPRGTTRGLIHDVPGTSPHVCKETVRQEQRIEPWGRAVHLSCTNALEHLVSGAPAWYHRQTKGGDWEEVDLRYGRAVLGREAKPAVAPPSPRSTDARVLSSKGGLVLLSLQQRDGGEYECRVGSHALARYNVTVDTHSCAAPQKAQDFQRIYADWCQEFHKYKMAVQSWESRQQVRDEDGPGCAPFPLQECSRKFEAAPGLSL